MPLNAKVAREQWERYSYCRDIGHLNYVHKSQKCEDFFSGDQWDKNDLAKLREQRRPGLTINKILGTLSGIMGEQIDLRTEIAYKARYGAPEGNADILTKVFSFISDQNQLDWVRSELFADGAITSRGYLDVRLSFEKSVTGDVTITNVNPRSVIPDPDAAEYDPDSWNDVLVTRWLTPDDVEYYYNKKDADELRQKTGSSYTDVGYDSIDTYADRFSGSSTLMLGAYSEAQSVNQARLIRVIDRQYRKLTKMTYLVNVKTGERQAVPFSWGREKIAAAVAASQGMLIADDHVGKRIRWTVTADDYVLHDEWSPYKHFTIIPYFPYFRYGRTIGLVENLLDPQELLNKTTSQELHVVNTMANSGWKIKRESLQNMTSDELEERGAQTGLVLELNDVKDAEKIQPNQIPQGLSELSRKGETYIKTVSMRGDAQTGMARADVSADQIDAQNREGDTGLRKAMDNLARTDFILARSILDLVQESYTDPRMMRITHNDVQGTQEQISINWPDPTSGELTNDISLGEYDVVVTSQPNKQTLEESQFQQAAYMKEKLGVAIPDEFLIQNSNLIGKSELIDALKAQAQTPEAQMQQKIQILSGQLEVANLKAEASKIEADALLKRSKAAKEVAQTDEIVNGGGDEQAQMELEAQKHTQEMAQNKEKHEQEMAQARDKHAMDQQIKQKSAEDKSRMDRAQAILTARRATQTKPGQNKPAKAV